MVALNGLVGIQSQAGGGITQTNGPTARLQERVGEAGVTLRICSMSFNVIQSDGRKPHARVDFWICMQASYMGYGRPGVVVARTMALWQQTFRCQPRTTNGPGRRSLHRRELGQSRIRHTLTDVDMSE